MMNSDVSKGADSAESAIDWWTMQDLVSFLEENFGLMFDESGGTEGESDDDDAEFTNLIANGTMDDIKNELDDVNLLEKQLSRWSKTLATELEDLATGGTGSDSRYLESMELDEWKTEIEARIQVVKSYLVKVDARNIQLRERIIKLQSKQSEGDDTRDVR